MQEFNEGDLVEAVKGESIVRGRVKLGTRANGTEGYKYLGDSAAIKEVYIHDGWTVTVIEKATPPLPTEPGWYLDKDNTELWVLESAGGWRDSAGEVYSVAVAANFAPFTHLAAVPVTAKRVLDAIRARIGSIDSAYDFQAVAAEFGVTAQ